MMSLVSHTGLLLAVTAVLGACSSPPASGLVDGGVVPPADDGGPGDGDAGDGGDAGSGDDGGGPPDLIAMCGAEPSTLEDWESCYQKRFCELVVNCGSMNLFSSVEECIALNDTVSGGRLSHEARERSRAIAAGRASLDEEAFAQCLVDLSPERCMNPSFSMSCVTRFAGTVGDFESCHGDVECESRGAACSAPSCDDACCLGVCEPRSKLEDRCFTLDDCEPGLRCSLDAYCVTGDVGARCSDSGDCDPSNWCDLLAGVCKADVPEGAPCSRLTQCGGETSCVGTRRRVAPPQCRRVNVEGDACDFVCLGNLYCDLSNPIGFGTCRSLPKHGESCSLFLPCIGKNEVCNAGACVTRPGAGEPCVQGACLPGLFCTDALGIANPTCEPRLADGEGACNQPDQCQSYICDADATGQCQSWMNSCP